MINSRCRILSLFVVGAIALASPHCAASATTMNGSLTVDNAFFAYISTDDSVLGTIVAQGDPWWMTFNFSAALTPGVTNYLHIEAINYGVYDWSAGFVGQFALSASTFHFANSTQFFVTQTAGWTGSYNNANSLVFAQPWLKPTGNVTSHGQNGVFPWYLRPGISSDAYWIWPDDGDSLPQPGWTCSYCTVDFSTPIYPSAPTPEPVTLLTVGTGVAVLIRALRSKLAAKE